EVLQDGQEEGAEAQAHAGGQQGQEGARGHDVPAEIPACSHGAIICKRRAGLIPGPDAGRGHAPMKTQVPTPDAHQEMRDALRDLCGRFDSAYWQKVDNDRGYPEAFVDALTEAGWMAALIPADYGGSGLGLTEASVIMEEINFSGGNAGALHG